MKNSSLSSFVRIVLTERLLTELRDVPNMSYPNTDTYKVTLLANGWVTYDPPAQKDELSKFLSSRYGSLDSFEITPSQKSQLDKLVDLGIVQKSTNKTSKYTFQYLKRLPNTPSEKILTIDDLPDTKDTYSKETLKHNTIPALIVNIADKCIDLDASWTEIMTRRGNAKPGKYQNTASFVIPSGDVSFANAQQDLQKVLKHILQHDKRVTQDFAIIGDEKYRGKTVGDVVGSPREKDIALTGKTNTSSGLIAYHGTSIKRWEQIKKIGLAPNKQGKAYSNQVEGWSDKNVYLTFDPATAENYATRQALWDGTKKAIVLKIIIPDPAKIVADEDFLETHEFEAKKDYTIFRRRRSFEETHEGSEWSKKYDPDQWERDRQYYEKNAPAPIVITKGQTVPIEFAFRILRGAESKEAVQKFGGEEKYVMNDDVKELAAFAFEVFKQSTKHSLKAGSFGYRGHITPNFIRPFEEYPLTKYPGKDAEVTDFETYQKVRKDTQQKAKRYD